MFDAQKYLEEYRFAEQGKAKIRTLKKAIAAADAAKEPEWQLQFRHMCMTDSVFGSDDADSMVIFPEMLALYDATPALHEEYTHKVLWDYKYILENAPDFHTIPLEQIEKLYADFAARCDRLGYSRRAWRFLRENYSLKTGNYLPESEYGAYAKEPEDELKDCTACERSYEVRYLLHFGHEDRAKERFAPIADGRLRCAEVPQTTYDAWIDFYQRCGNYTEAIAYGRKLAPYLHENDDLLDEIGTLMSLYAKTNPVNGLNLFRLKIAAALECRNHWMKMKFFIGAYHLFLALGEDDVVVHFPREFPLYREDHTYDAPVLAEYFHTQARELAEKFDKRDGNDFYTTMLDEDFPECTDENRVDMTHGFAEYKPSCMAAVMPVGIALADWDTILERITSEPDLLVDNNEIREEDAALNLRIKFRGRLYHSALIVHKKLEFSGFRLAHPFREKETQAFTTDQPVLLSLVEFDDAFFNAYQLQLKLLCAACPDAAAVVDFSREKALAGDWVRLQIKSEVTVLPRYLYNFYIAGEEESDAVWICTQGMRCCGLRELEILDATRENYGAYCDFLGFATEGFLLRGQLPDSLIPRSVVRREDGSPVNLTWLPAAKIGEYYPPENSGALGIRVNQVSEDEDADQNAVLFLHMGENADGSPKLARMNKISDEEFEDFRYGQYYAEEDKIAALAQERYPIFRKCFGDNPENAFVKAQWDEDDEDGFWLLVTDAGEETIRGVLEGDCAAGKEGENVEITPDMLLTFSLKLGENTLTPDTAYLGL